MIKVIEIVIYAIENNLVVQMQLRFIKDYIKMDRSIIKKEININQI